MKNKTSKSTRDLIKASEDALRVLEQIFYDDRKEVVRLKKSLDKIKQDIE